MERSYIVEILKKKAGKVLVKGWVHDLRDLGKIRFLLLRDMTGIIQVTANKDNKTFKNMEQSRESVVEIEGKAV